MRVGFDAREGLTLHQISLDDGDRQRPVIYRASVPEMVVPYGDPPVPVLAELLRLPASTCSASWPTRWSCGCDCLGEIPYLDATVADDFGEPQVIRNAVCIHEEDFGILWKHTDIFNGSAQTRRQRRLVVSFFATVGNYDYGFYWYFYLDGTIELRGQADRRRCSPRPTRAATTRTRPRSRPGLGAPVHQHLFSARLDMTVDGLANAVEEVDFGGLPIGPDNPYGNAIAQTVTRLGRESEAARRVDATAGRTWRVVNTERAEPVRPAGRLHAVPGGRAGAAGRPGRPRCTRGPGSPTNHLWVTRYDPAQRYPAGDFVNQHPGGAGLPAFMAPRPGHRRRGHRASGTRSGPRTSRARRTGR